MQVAISSYYLKWQAVLIIVNNGLKKGLMTSKWSNQIELVVTKQTSIIIPHKALAVIIASCIIIIPKAKT